MTLSGRQRPVLWAVLTTGLLLRLFLASRPLSAATAYDGHLFTRAADIFVANPLRFYTEVSRQVPPPGGWPYPPLFLAWMTVARALALAGAGHYLAWFKLPMIAADAAIAWVVQDHVGRTGGGLGARIQSAGLIALGPTFWLISGYHGHLDSVAILPAVIATVLWERPGTRRPLLCGVLIGLGAAVKTVPILLLIPLLASSANWRERALLVLPAVFIPAIALMPFALADPGGVLSITHYQSLPGFGGYSLLLQPNLANDYLQVGPHVAPSAVSTWVLAHGGLTTLAGLGIVTPFLWLRRTPPIRGAVIMWLTVYAFTGGFFFQYLVWGVPFMVLAGYRLPVAALLSLACIPEAVVYLQLQSGIAVRMFQFGMAGMYLLFVAAWALMLGRELRRSPGPPGTAGTAGMGARSGGAPAGARAWRPDRC